QNGVTRIRQQLIGLAEGDPARCVDLVPVGELAAADVHVPVADTLGPALRVRVERRRQLRTEGAHETGLLFDLPESALLVRLVRLGLPLGEAPVVVPRPVDDENLGTVESRTRNDASCGPNDADQRLAACACFHSCDHTSGHAARDSARRARSSSTRRAATGFSSVPAQARISSSATTASWWAPSTSCAALAAVTNRAPG